MGSGNLLNHLSKVHVSEADPAVPHSLQKKKHQWGPSSDTEELNDHGQVTHLCFIFLDCSIGMEMSVAEMLWD